MKRLHIIIILFFLLSATEGFSREFLNTYLHLNFGGMYTFATRGDMLDAEKSAIDDTFPDSHETSHYDTAYGVTLDVVPMKPIILGMESHAVKFGVRGAYRFHFVQQKVSSGEEYGDELMYFKSWMLGPVIHYAPSIESSYLNTDYSARGGFTAYALFGRLDGTLSPYRAVEEYSGSSPAGSTSVKGYKIDIGVGGEISLCSLNFGINVYYSKTTFRTGDQVYSDRGKNFTMREGCMELYVGIPIESFIEPLIPAF